MRCHTRPQILGLPLQFLFEFSSRPYPLWSSKLAYAKSFTCSARVADSSAANPRLLVPSGSLQPGRAVPQIGRLLPGIMSLSTGGHAVAIGAMGFKSVSSAARCAHPEAVRTRDSSEMAVEQSVSAVEPAIGELPKQETGKRFAVLMTGHAPEGAIRKYGGYGEMFVHLLSDPGETWDIFAVIEGKFPSDEELESYDGFVVSGSRHDAHGSEPWIEKLCEILRQVHEKKKRTLGVCFGHQVLSRALGGTTGRSSVGWEIGLKEITVSEALLAKPYGLGLPRALKILEIHRDAVCEVPPGAEVLAWSEKTGIEMFSVGEHTLGIQGHPEFTRDVEEEILEGRLALGVLKEEQVNAAKKSMDEGQADAEILQKLCKAFLKGN